MDKVSGHYGDGTVADASRDLVEPADAEIEEQNGDFDQRDRSDVEKLREIEDSEETGNVALRKIVSGMS